LDSDHIKRFLDSWAKISRPKRRQLIGDFGQLADDQFDLSFEPINRALLTDEEPDVRLQAIRNLWECDDPALVGALLKILEEDASAGVREAAAHALGRFVYLSELDKLKRVNSSDLEHALIGACREDSSSAVRDECLISLGFSSHTEVPDLILDAYRSEQEATMLAALKAMRHSANDLWREHVVEQLYSPIPELRAEAVRAAGELELRELSDDIISHLDDVSDLVRRAAIWALGQIGGNSALEALGQLMDEPQDEEESNLIADAIDNLVSVDGTEESPFIDLDFPEESSS
jgi:HEAT repeat protein